MTRGTFAIVFVSKNYHILQIHLNDIEIVCAVQAKGQI